MPRPSVCEVERDVIGHLAVGPPQLAGQHGAEVGIFQARLVAPAAHHQAGRRCRGRRSCVFSERMMQVCFIRWAIFGISSEMCDAGDRGRDRAERSAGGGAGLGVPGLQLARTAGQPEQDARASAASSARRPAPGCCRTSSAVMSAANAAAPTRPSCRGTGADRRRVSGEPQKRRLRAMRLLLSSRRLRLSAKPLAVESLASMIEPKFGAGQQRPHHLPAAPRPGGRARLREVVAQQPRLPQRVGGRHRIVPHRQLDLARLRSLSLFSRPSRRSPPSARVRFWTRRRC